MIIDIAEHQYSPQLYEALANEGYIVIPDFLPAEMTEELYYHVSHFPVHAFKQAGIGRRQDQQLNSRIRRDKTRWLTKFHPVEQRYLDVMAQYHVQLNRQLFLGLRDFEAHFAHYETGSFYQRHIDAFRGRSNRVVSSVFYLNSNWLPDDGGELVIYQPVGDEVLCTVSPKFGNMVFFLSEQFPHEVLPAKRDRYSIAGWFRTDNPRLRIKGP